MYFVPTPTTYMSPKEVNTLWDDLEKQGLILKGKDDNEIVSETDKRHKLDVYLKAAKIIGKPVIPPRDFAFESICKEYKEDWEKHAPNIINTTKTFTIT